jgi:hypothetical protein
MWRYAVGQATGGAHEKISVPCQDRFRCEVLEHENTLIATVADGAGSAPLASDGAELAVATVNTVVQLGLRAGRRDYCDVLREAAAVARQRLVDEAQSRNVPLKHFACTLLVTIVAPVGGAALQIGDGVIVVRDHGAAWRWMFWPKKGEYANATCFLTDETALNQSETATLPNEVQDIALTSDGLEGLALHYATQTAHEPFFRTAFAPIHAAREDGELAALSTSLSQFLRSPSVRARTDDDTTLILASRRPRTT